MRTKSEWLKIFKEQEESGLNPKEYCEKHTINVETFKKIKWKFSRTSIEKEDKDKPEAEQPAIDTDSTEKIKWSIVQTTSQIEKEPLTIELGKFKIKIDEKSNLSNLKKVCEVLIGLC